VGDRRACELLAVVSLAQQDAELALEQLLKKRGKQRDDHEREQ